MQALFNQATALHQQGQLKQAEPIYRQLLDAAPDHPVINARYAILLQQTGRVHQALEFIKLAVSKAPQEFDLLMQGASLASQAGENQLAEVWLKEALILQPDSVAANEQLAGVCISTHQEDKALEYIKKVIRLDPKNANAYNLKGLAQSRLGDTEKGYASFQKAIKLNPGLIPAIRNMVLYGKGQKDPLLDQLIPQLEENYLKAQQPPQVQMNIAYILSMFFEKQKDTQKTFKYLKEGNDLNRRGYQYAHNDTVNLFSSISNAFDSDFKQAYESKVKNDNAVEGPIFILGMPRSGTTLIEQILSSHSLVEAEGEILDLRESFDQHSDVLSGECSLEEKIRQCKEIGEKYLASVRARQSSPFFTDKMPYNFMMLGAIALALPKAKIIHCTRSPLETCFSIYKQNFAGSHAYTNNLTELGQYYKEYEKLMVHWNQLFGDKIYEANYETMVEDSESEIKRLLDFCGLEREDACFEFHKNKRAVRTASVAQVRQPIYKSAMKASSPYAEQLKPLIDELG